MAQSLEAGVWGVIPTPFHGSTQDVDADSLAGLAEHYEAAGAVGLTALGVFGESLALTVGERRLVLETIVESTALPLVVGISSLATRPAIEEILAAQAVAGTRVRAVMVQVNSAGADAVVNHLQAIHRATAAQIVLQDYPVASGVSIGGAALADVVNRCSFVVAVKAEAPPTSVAIAQLTAAVKVSVFGGLGGQGLLDELAAGAAGAMTGFSFPEALVACVRAWQSGGHDAAREVLTPFLPLINFEQQARIALSVRKELFKSRGLIKESAVRAPATPFPEVLRDGVDRHLAVAGRALENLSATTAGSL